METQEFTIKASEHYLNSHSRNLFPTNIELTKGDLLKVNSKLGLPKNGSSYKYDKNTAENSDTTLTEQDCPLYPLCKLSQLNN